MFDLVNIPEHRAAFVGCFVARALVLDARLARSHGARPRTPTVLHTQANASYDALCACLAGPGYQPAPEQGQQVKRLMTAAGVRRPKPRDEKRPTAAEQRLAQTLAPFQGELT